jgi:hypothetical protein
MKTIICPKCNQVIAVPDDKDFIICCGEVIYVPDEAYDSENEKSVGIS